MKGNDFMKQVKMTIEKTDINGNVTTYRTLMDAARSITSKAEDWKIALSIASVLGTSKRAYKCNWKKI